MYFAGEGNSLALLDENLSEVESMASASTRPGTDGSEGHILEIRDRRGNSVR